jgi:hypothetical protein
LTLSADESVNFLFVDNSSIMQESSTLILQHYWKIQQALKSFKVVKIMQYVKIMNFVKLTKFKKIMKKIDKLHFGGGGGDKSDSMYCFTAVNNRNDLKLGPFCLMLRSWLES